MSCYANEMNYRDILKYELDTRMAENSQYSLRAFAQLLKTSASMLSLILSGKRNLSAKKAFEVCRVLKFDTRKTDYFITLVQLEGARSPESILKLQEKMEQLRPKSAPVNLELDVFKLISDWHHYPIIEMTRTTLPTPTTESVAKYLGVSTKTAEEAIERLQRLELLRQDESGKLYPCKSRIMSSSNRPNLALRNFHRQMLNKASLSLETQSPQEKFIGSETFAFNAENLAKASEIIEDCFSKIVRLASTSKERQHVYHLGIQMFRITRDFNE